MLRTLLHGALAFMMALAFVAVVEASEWWNYPGGWQICRDSDGWVVFKPDGGNDAWGTSYNRGQIERSYRLRREDAYGYGSDNVSCYE